MKPIELHSGSPEFRVQNLLRLLDVEPTGDHLFRGLRKEGGIGRIYGGEVVAQALVAAAKTVPGDRNIHSLHAYFLRGGSEDQPSSYNVSTDFDGRSFSNRRVVAVQQGEVILNLAASFHRLEAGRFHQAPRPDVPAPEDLVDVTEVAESRPPGSEYWPLSHIRRLWPIEWRVPPALATSGADVSTEISFWFRTPAAVDAPQWMHRAILAYASDIGPMTTASRPYARLPRQGASIDHSIWFHDDLRVDDWLLYCLQSPWAGHARGFATGNIYDRTGRLVASVAQEGLIRFGGKE